MLFKQSKSGAFLGTLFVVVAVVTIPAIANEFHLQQEYEAAFNLSTSGAAYDAAVRLIDLLRKCPEGWNNELERNIEFGEMCGSSGYIWCETYNKDLGQDIWNNRRNRAFNEIGEYGPSEEQLLKETASKYYYGPSGEYWNRDYLRETPPQWIPNSGAWVDYADNWYEHYANEPWEDNLVCPCNPDL